MPASDTGNSFLLGVVLERKLLHLLEILVRSGLFGSDADGLGGFYCSLKANLSSWFFLEENLES